MPTPKRREALWWAQSDYLLAIIGFAVGAGNLFRFPARVFEYGTDVGGGAFIISYLICVIVIGWPVTYLQLYWGQFSGHSVTQVFGEISPIFAGLGWAFVLITIPLAAHYNMIVAYAMHYLWDSVKAFVDGSDLPWNSCEAFENLTDVICCQQLDDSKGLTAMEIYLHQNVFNRIGHSVIDWGSMQWPLLACLAIAWAFTLFAMRSGVHSIGQIVYITATYPYFIIISIFFHAITLPGAFDGLLWYITPDFGKLLSRKMWVGSANQVFYSLGIDVFALISFASYNRPRSNVWRDSLILIMADTLTSLFGGVVLFMLAGQLQLTSAVSQGMSILKSDAYGLAFVVYPYAMATVPASPPLFSILFFSMIILAAIDCQFAWLEQIFGAVKHVCGWAAKKSSKLHWLKKFAEGSPLWKFRILTFPFPFSMTTIARAFRSFAFDRPADRDEYKGGYAIFKLLDHYSVLVNEFMLAAFTIYLVAYVYKPSQVFRDISQMLKHIYPHLDPKKQSFQRAPFYFRWFGPTGFFFTLTWLILPFLLALLVVQAILDEIDDPPTILPSWNSVRSDTEARDTVLLLNSTQFGITVDEATKNNICDWTRAIGMFISMFPLVVALLVAIYRKRGQKLSDLLKPKPSWRQRMRRYDSESDDCGSLSIRYPRSQGLVSAHNAMTNSTQHADSLGHTALNSLRMRKSLTNRQRQMMGADNIAFESNEFATATVCTPSTSQSQQQAQRGAVAAAECSVWHCACKTCTRRCWPTSQLNAAYNNGRMAVLQQMSASSSERQGQPTSSRFLITSVTDEADEATANVDSSDAAGNRTDEHVV